MPVYHSDVRAWEVRSRDGRLVGLFYFDPYARKGKQSGAWMSGYRSQERFDGDIAPIVSNNCNYAKPAPGEPILISWDDATTLFHEFGHALHGLCSNVGYPSLSGTNVARDYVEFPSQLLEHWLFTPEVLDRIAIHERTGKPIPQELVAKACARRCSKTLSSSPRTALPAVIAAAVLPARRSCSVESRQASTAAIRQACTLMADR